MQIMIYKLDIIILNIKFPFQIFYIINNITRKLWNIATFSFSFQQITTQDKIFAYLGNVNQVILFKKENQTWKHDSVYIYRISRPNSIAVSQIDFNHIQIGRF